MKKVRYVLTSITAFLLAMPVFAAKCTSGETKACKKALGACIDNKIPNTVHFIILAIQIIVPVLLVIFGMIDLVKAVVAGKEDEIKKAQNVFLRRLIVGVLIFFVIVIVKLLVSFVGDFNDGMTDCMNVFLNGVNK